MSQFRIAGSLATLCLGTVLICAPGAGAVEISVDHAADLRPLSPLIFGVNYGDAARNATMGYPLRRWGGNATSRYNWKIDVHNTGADWYFENIPGASDRSQQPPLGNAADSFIAETRQYGGDLLITVPTIGWAPRANSPLVHPYFTGFSIAKYGPQQDSDPWDPDAGNGVRTNGDLVLGNDPTDTSTAVGADFWKGWIVHLKSRFGAADGGGVRFYALDNEVMLWNSTHRDVHPAPATYDETLGKALTWGAMIKSEDPTALVTGPSTWGYCDLFGSAADSCIEGADRDAHGGLPFVAWYLQQICANPLTGGLRAVDVLDLHYYPQGAGVSMSDDDSSATAARRLRALRELYDPNWVSESWISDLGNWDDNHYDRPNLIPRVRGWIDQYCPETRLGITEYRWGNDGTASGAVAQAELFGIFAREGVYLANRWIAPEANTRVERAFQLFLNYDGAGARVAGSSARATSADIDRIGAYAFVDAGRRMLLLTNKTESAQDVAIHFATAPGAQWRLYGFDAEQPVQQVRSGTLAGSTLSLAALPPMSASLLVVSAGDLIFTDGFD